MSDAGLPAEDSSAPEAGFSHDILTGIAAGVLTVVALVAALYLARGFFVPLLIGILGSYALRPLVNGLKSVHVPRSVGAALVLSIAVGSLSWVGFTLSDDVAAVIEKLPEAARTLREKLNVARSGAPSALQNMQDAATELEGAASDAGARQKHGAKPAPRQASAPTWLRDYALSQTALLVSVAAQAPIVLLLTYFLLASGHHFRRKLLVLVGSSLTRKKDAVRILDEVDSQVQHYLLVMLASNAALAVAAWLVFLALGLEHASILGAAAGVLHFIPYLGTSLIVLSSGTAALLQSGSLTYTLVVSGVALALAGSIGFLFMNWLQSRFARVNPAVLFISLLFFGWLWGVWGLLLGAPLVAIAKAVFDRVDTLNPAGELLGR